MTVEYIQLDTKYYRMPTDDLAMEAGCVFRPEYAERYIRFFEEVLRFNLIDWQRKLLYTLFGWRRKKDNTVRYRSANIHISRKNGKSEWAAALAIAMMVLSEDDSPCIYVVGTTNKQARIVYESAMKRCIEIPALSSRMQVNEKMIKYPKRFGKIEALAGDTTGGGKYDGLNAAGVVIDECWAYTLAQEKIVHSLLASTRAKKNSLILQISHAGIANYGYGHNQYLADRRLLDTGDGSLFHFALVFESDPTNWECESGLNIEEVRKANPSLGITFDVERLEEDYETAKRNPSLMPLFLRESLGIWQTKDDKQWIDANDWEACKGDLSLPQLRQSMLGKRVTVGIDLSKCNDLTAISIIHEHDGMIDVLTECFIPRDVMAKNEAAHKINYSLYAQQGLLHITDGNIIDMRATFDRLLEIDKEFFVVEYVFDRAMSTALMSLIYEYAPELAKKFVEYSATQMQLTPPIQEWERLVLGKKIRHGGNPLFAIQVLNAKLKANATGDLFRLVKKVESNTSYKIDSLFAAIIALGRILTNRAIEAQKANTPKGPLIVSLN